MSNHNAFWPSFEKKMKLSFVLTIEMPEQTKNVSNLVKLSIDFHVFLSGICVYKHLSRCTPEIDTVAWRQWWSRQMNRVTGKNFEVQM